MGKKGGRPTTYPRWLVSLMQQRGIDTVEDLSLAADVPQTYIYRVLHGVHNKHGAIGALERLDRLAGALGISLGELCERIRSDNERQSEGAALVADQAGCGGQAHTQRVAGATNPATTDDRRKTTDGGHTK